MNQNARTWLELPPGLTGISSDAQLALNDRLRTIGAALDRASAGTTSGVAGSAGSQLILTVPGTLGIRTDAAPRVSLPAASTPVGIVSLLKQASQGASVKFTIAVGGVAYTQVELIAGSVSATGGALGAIAANSLVTLDLTQVGTTFPGADLSVLVRF